MAIAYDAGSAQSSTGSSATVSHTITGTNVGLLVGVYCNSSQTVSGITWNGSSMTQVNSFTSGGDYVTLYKMVAPATGTHNIVVTMTGSNNYDVVGASYSGVDQTNFINTNLAQQSSSGSTQAFTETSTVDNCWQTCFVRGTQSSPTAGANTTQRSGTSSAFFDTNAVISPAGSNTLTTNQSPAGFVYQAGAMIQPPQGGTGLVPRRALLGVGI